MFGFFKNGHDEDLLDDIHEDHKKKMRNITITFIVFAFIIFNLIMYLMITA